jgi:hypothetical protein
MTTTQTTSTPEQTLQFIDQYWSMISERPRMFGSLDSVESRLTTLLEVRHQIVHPWCELHCPNLIWSKYVARIFGGQLGLVGNMKKANPDRHEGQLMPELIKHMDNIKEWLIDTHPERK